MSNITRLILAALLLFRGAALATIEEDTTEQVYEFSPTASLSIRNTDGRIYIYGSDAPELRIKAVRRAFTKERLEGIKVDVVASPDSAVIETIYPPIPEGSLLADRSGTVDYTILLPQTCTLSKVELAKGEVIIEGMFGSIDEARLGNGLMHLLNCFGSAHVNLGEGGLDLLYGWWEARAFSVSAEVGDGDLRLGLPVDAALHVDAATTSGQITNRLAPEQDLADAKTLETTIGSDSSAKFTLRTSNGNIKIEKDY